MVNRAQAPIRAQGTIEYLVVIGVVVVISLVVVGLLTGLASNSDTAKTAKKIGAYSSGISVTDAAMDSSGDAIFVM
jgi:NADH:ubiquinone oxidoreductase subunit 3 (subunit A)